MEWKQHKEEGLCPTHSCCHPPTCPHPSCRKHPHWRRTCHSLVPPIRIAEQCRTRSPPSCLSMYLKAYSTAPDLQSVSP
ncbi:hypothetical protein XENTR_v10010829 [Xenopus tropicalis]|nr:hypothetical protein XENTR_v10010829 [Xenopus tropicalis]